ncbi:HAMP domain-containing histidine kinase [Dactylosporangium roseum]|uniref:Sensor histidine kinase MtrB n=1 Tax=Dactylosporangium roseum TaxID=47989 RepID=A0ABY5Z4R5_9ACTN|nr:MtrAB system histidine kinase MtrB [Dactylosporangium roseum]UWZ35847.1 HAMP domain-containing histidine kinase [Dactylosporangium roseum]
MRIDPVLVQVRRLRPKRLVPLAVSRRARRFWAATRRRWRRSLQFRVVGITLLLSAALVLAFGYTVASLISQGVLESRINTAKEQISGGATYAAHELEGFTQADDPGLPGKLQTVAGYLATSMDVPGAEVIVMRRGSKPASWPEQSAYQVMNIPAMRPMRQVVGSRPGTYQQIATLDVGMGPRKYLVLGTRVATAGDPVELYYLLPLQSEDELVQFVALVVTVTGIALVALLALIAAMMTRLVVKPVRVAARTAQRLSAGLLDQRMGVKGEDDLARLAAAFNQMAANLQRQIVRLEEMSRLQRRFTSDVSHELRTPLTTVRMAADLLFASREDFDPAAARSAELLQAELDRFEGLLTDLLEISRFDAGFAALDAEPTDLVPVVRRAGERLASLAERCGVPLRVDTPDTEVIAEVDPRRVERILRNLVGNAVEHGEGKPVVVTLAADSSAVAVTVRDHGVGLKTGEEKLVFNRFWRADPSRARQTGGTGLGLSISLEDARLHGGWLEAWGASGKGAQFRLTLPTRSGDRLVSSPLRLVPDDARADETALIGETS